MKKHHKIRSAVITVLLANFTLTACASREALIGYQGVIYDSATGQPMKDVYVMAQYFESGGFGHSSTWCVKTAGMYTGVDGKFTLPASFRATLLYPIKLGFIVDGPKTFAAQRAHGRNDFFMMAQVPDSPQQSEYVSCSRAEPADVIPNIEYLKILSAEDRRYRGNSEIVDRTITRLQRRAAVAVPAEAATH